MINEIREFLSACPHIEGRLININHLGSKAGSLSLESISSSRTVKRYTDGARLCSARLCLAARQTASQSLSSNRDAAELLERVCAWLEEQSLTGELPKLAGNCKAVAIVVESSPAVNSVSDMTARHELMFEVRYFQGN